MAGNWPSWRYGPKGEAQIFQREADVPQGWVDSPSKLPPALEKLVGDDANSEVEALRAELARKTADWEELSKAGREQVKGLVEDNEHLLAENARLNALVEAHEERQRELEAEIEQIRQQTPVSVSTAAQSVRRPRKLTAAKGTPFTPADETVTLDEGRAERLRVLRDAGIEISDDATDGDIEEALDWLEKQAKG